MLLLLLMLLSMYHTLKCFVVAVEQHYVVRCVVGVVVKCHHCCVNEIVPVFLGTYSFCKFN